MFYIYRPTAAVSEAEASPKEDNIHLTEGIIHQVDVMFQSGCALDVHVQIWRGNLQIWPSNRGATMTGDATIISFREFFPVSPGNQTLTIKSWSGQSVVDKYIEVHIGILPKKIIQPLSFEELLIAAAGIEEK